ncbi:MAG: hypothetical protein ACR2M3_08960 [Thermomicrobiales bacterium]
MAAQQTESNANDQTEGRKALKRRGILAAAAAVVAGIAAKQMAEPVAAGIDGDLVLNTTGQVIVGETGVRTDNTYNVNTGGNAFIVDCSATTTRSMNAIYGSGSGSGTGVQGNGGGDTSGNDTGFPVGVRGSVSNTGFGVHGNAGNGTGVYGTATGGFGVYGVSTSNYGVVGQSTSGVGVSGASTSVIGVRGQSDRFHGVFGVAGDQPGAAGLLGYSNTANGVAFGSVVTAPATLAGYFNGEVHVVGPFIVDDPANKHGAIDHSDGTTRLVYSMESPESWIEDFGTGTLSNGKASIALDPGFAGVVHTDDYHVFLTEHDTHYHLNVMNRQATGFTVTADAEGAALKGKKAADLSGTFSYRIVAKPKVGRVVERLPKYTRPTPLDIPAIEKLAKATTTKPPISPKKP